MILPHQLKIPTLDIKEVGVITEVKQGIIKVQGLPSCIYGQLVEFNQGAKGMVMGFNAREVLVIVLGDDSNINMGDTVSSQSELLTVPVGNAFIGRIVDCLGNALDGKGPVQSNTKYPVFMEAFGVLDREPVTHPLQTGTKIIDMAIPIGKGQRELIIGDRQTGKTSIAVDAIINQKGKDVVCVYCYVGGSHTSLKRVVDAFSEKGAFEYTIIVAADAACLPAEQYLCPYAAAAIGEFFMFSGRDVLVVFDDLTKHAWAYRQISLLLERPPGREAYPGDIFYIHSHLLERAARLKAELGGGSMTFLPIATTLQGDITGYIQSNLVSITDGQIYLNTLLFREGFKPAIDMGLSVSRIGSKVQCPAVKQVSGGLRLEYAQYRELMRLTRLRTKLSDEAMVQMRRGEALHELLTQVNYEPVSWMEEVILFYALKRKILEVLDTELVKKFKNEIFAFISREDPGLIAELEKIQDLIPEIKSGLDSVFIKYFNSVQKEGSAVEPDYAVE